ncbi:hypothetical protein [Pseudoxanthomonas suwonensis]|uniref:Protein sip-5 n=1 Tax=Pseudoxanthomonas suwonensis TaxID=314722 RepID=A0A0E3UND2_9GAMM|nr:hypothetical protein [Pseudoxanthomonas suwonensis]AKC87066.1 hypothetical protein WQ53_10220 [Pseudoxanthomonas suwonensis]
MRFELLRQRVERAERRVAACGDRAEAHRHEFGQAWRRGWTPGRIVVAGLVSGFLVGRAEPLSKIGGSRWLQMLSTVSSMVASLRAAAASEEAGQSADVAAQEAAAANQNVAAATGQAPAAATAPAAADLPPARAPSPAEAATELSER